MKASIPANEVDRLAALRQYSPLDTAPEAVFDDLVLLAAQICDTPIGLISFIEADRQWFKARVGLTGTEISRDVSFCAHAILQPDEVLIVPDALADERFAANPLVTADPQIRFYAGAPLVTDDGYALGTLCVIDRVPRELTARQIAALETLRRAVMAEIQLRYGVNSLSQTVAERDLALATLQEAKAELEIEIQERTAELRQANEQLQRELAERQQVEAELQSKVQQSDLAYQQAAIYAKELNEKIGESKRAEQALEEERALLAQRVAERTAELSAANAELARAARAKDEFLASMSHELRTPLHAILGLSEVLQAQTRGPLSEDQLKFLRIIEESGRHLLALINDILDVAKIEAGKLELQSEPVLVEAVCQASLQFIKQAAVKKNIRVSFTLDPVLVFIQADARRLKQILVNLLHNAAKFTPEGGQVGLEVRDEPEAAAVRFIVWDTGPGIPPEHLPRLFQPFVQIDSSLSRTHEGTGLGLALVSRLVELHGGSVSVESDGVPGRGSRFIVSLPWQTVVISSKAEPSSRLEPGLTTTTPQRSFFRQDRGSKDAGSATEHPLILLAEDNEANIQLLTDYLEGEGYRVVVARHGAEALARASEERPALILMDIQMPGMDGLEAIGRLRTESQLTSVPIIALTALAMPGDRERCLAAGANDYLSKPVSLKKLVSAIAVYLEPTQT
ncbi:MAG: response regulator [Anaerolineae bacterium]|nr:response regulator [Anaerolineae bacterium]